MTYGTKSSAISMLTGVDLLLAAAIIQDRDSNISGKKILSVIKKEPVDIDELRCVQLDKVGLECQITNDEKGYVSEHVASIKHEPALHQFAVEQADCTCQEKEACRQTSEQQTVGLCIKKERDQCCVTEQLSNNAEKHLTVTRPVPRLILFEKPRDGDGTDAAVDPLSLLSVKDEHNTCLNICPIQDSRDAAVDPLSLLTGKEEHNSCLGSPIQDTRNLLVHTLKNIKQDPSNDTVLKTLEAVDPLLLPMESENHNSLKKVSTQSNISNLKLTSHLNCILPRCPLRRKPERRVVKQNKLFLPAVVEITRLSQNEINRWSCRSSSRVDNCIMRTNSEEKASSASQKVPSTTREQSSRNTKRVVSSNELPLRKKEFTCSVCKREYDSASTFHRHIRIHMEEEINSSSAISSLHSVEQERNPHIKLQLRDPTDDEDSESDVLAENVFNQFVCNVCGKAYESVNTFHRHVRIHMEEALFSSKNMDSEISQVARWKCELCKKTYADASILATHMLKHSTEKPFICNDCGNKYKTKRDLREHILVHIDEEQSRIDELSNCLTVKNFTCNVCGKQYESESTFHRHVRIHMEEEILSSLPVSSVFSTELPLNRCVKQESNESRLEMEITKAYVCSECDCQFSSKSTYYRHIRTHMEEKTVSSGNVCFKCMLCEKKYDDSSKLDLHMLKHSSLRPFSCNDCDVKLRNRYELTMHKKTHEFACQKCSRTYITSKALEDHMVYHSGLRPFACSTCSKMFTSRASCKIHEYIHNGNWPYKCDECPKGFSGKNCLDTHKLEHKGIRKFHCDKCQRSFAWRGDFKKHLRTHLSDRPRPFACSLCTKTYRQCSELKKHALVHIQSLPCSICQKTFSKKSHLRRHVISIHTKAWPYRCPICNRGFMQKTHLDMHKNVHVVHPCDQCDKTYDNASQLRCHKQSFHEKIKRFHCGLCERKFRDRANLSTHMIRHKGLKPFKCDLCDKRYAEKVILSRHKLSHTDAVYNCGDCNRTFKSLYVFRNHKRSHINIALKSFVCDVCNKICSSKTYLKEHKLVHSGIKIFSCLDCDCRFATRGKLNRHMLCHSDFRPFVCKVCNRAYKSRGSMRQHMALHSDVKAFGCDECDKRFTTNGCLTSHKLCHTRNLACDMCAAKFTYKLDLTAHVLSHNSNEHFTCDVCNRAYTTQSGLKAHLSTAHSAHNK